MKQIKALLLKEWQTNRYIFLTPLWFTLGVYCIASLGFIINIVKSNSFSMKFSASNLPTGMENIALFTSSAGTVGAVGLVAMITAIILADVLINGGLKRKCEILHLSQPVSLTKIVATKYLFMTLGLILLLGLVTLVNSVFISLLMRHFTGAHLYFGITAWAQTVIQAVFPLLFVSSAFWFFAGLFKRKSFFMGVLLILSIQAAISILNFIADMHIPSLVSYIMKLSTIQFRFSPDMMSGSTSQLCTIIENRWQSLFDIDTLARVLYSIFFFFAGAYLYSHRELS